MRRLVCTDDVGNELGKAPLAHVHDRPTAILLGESVANAMTELTQLPERPAEARWQSEVYWRDRNVVM